MRRLASITIVLALLALLTAALPANFCTRHPNHWKCGPSPSPTAAPTPTPSPTPTPTPTPTASPTPTPGGVTFFDDFTGTTLGQVWTGPKCAPFGAETAEWNPARTSVHDGSAHIQAVRLSANRWSSDLLSTWGFFEQRYGWFEARIKIPEGRGLWPAFWVLERDPVNQCGNGPGELDAMEVLANPEGTNGAEDVSLLFQVTHFHDGSQVMRWHETGLNLSADYHVYGVEWRETYVDYYLDGVRTQHIEVTPEQLPGNFYVLLDLAVGGWPGPSDSTTPSPSTMLVDWVSVKP